MNRSRKRSAFFASMATLTFLAVMVLSPVATQAKPPGWGFERVTAIPGAVTAGKNVAFDLKIMNGGRSNISSLLMSTDLGADNPLAVPLAVWDVSWSGQPAGSATPCGTAPYATALSCDFGALVAQASVSLKVAFKTPSTGTSWAFNFLLTGNGNTPSDTGGTSHGDTKPGPASVTLTSITSNPDSASGFVLDVDTFSTLENLTKQNPQSASVTTRDNLQPATIQESNSYGNAGTTCSTANCIGQWVTITAPNPGDSLISGSLLIYGKGIPGAIGPSDIVLRHLDGSGDDGVIGDEPGERCASAADSASAPCIFVTEVGQNFRIDFWLTHNGSLRGTW